MKRFIVCSIASIALASQASCQHTSSPKGEKTIETPVDAAPPQRLVGRPVAAPPALATAHTARYASSSRNSAVDIDHRSLSSITRIAAEDQPAPRFLLLHPKGTHVVEERGAQVAWRKVTGEPAGTLLNWTDGLLVARERGVETAHGYLGYDGTTRFVGDSDGPAGASTIGWAVREQGDRLTLVIEIPLTGFHEGMTAAHDVVRSYRSGASGVTEAWEQKTDPGCGAIAGDGSVVIGTNRGSLIVFDPAGHLILEAKLGFVPVDVSITQQGFAFVSRTASGKQVVHMIDRKGAIAWELEAPFELGQPVIEGGGGRVYLSGRGFVAIDGGKVNWGTPEARDVRATAFRDGWIAVAVGAELRLVGRDGAIEKSFRTADGEPIGGPPAIGLDGSVWFATSKGLYVAR